MRVSFQTSHLATVFSKEEAIKMIADAGFDVFDFSLFDMMYNENDVFNSEGFREYAYSLREIADKAGIKCNQAHAPFPSSCGRRDEDDLIFGKIVRSMEAASIIGADVIVVHPKQHLVYATHGNPQLLEEFNVDFYRKLIPYCEKFNIRVACENMFQWDGINERATDSTCASGEEFARYIDRIGSPRIVACLDIGHAPLVGKDPAEIIRTLGHDRLKALHVHDNDGRYDLHTAPFTVKNGRNIDFEAVTKALADIKYDGDFTFECDNFLSSMPNDLKADGLAYVLKAGRKLVKMIEEAEN